MHAISTKDAGHSLASLLSTAQRTPVAIQQDHKSVAVVLSEMEYRRLRGRRRAPAGLIDGRLIEMLDSCEA